MIYIYFLEKGEFHTLKMSLCCVSSLSEVWRVEAARPGRLGVSAVSAFLRCEVRSGHHGGSAQTLRLPQEFRWALRIIVILFFFFYLYSYLIFVPFYLKINYNYVIVIKKHFSLFNFFYLILIYLFILIHLCSCIYFYLNCILISF